LGAAITVSPRVVKQLSSEELRLLELSGALLASVLVGLLMHPNSYGNY
jgi:hypothetical protein